MAKHKEKPDYKARSIPEGKTQVNFNINNSNLEKIEAIAYLENANKSELYNLALERFIEAYEKKNGKIQPRPKGEGLKKL